MGSSPSILIVGGGVAGLSTAWWLGRMGLCSETGSSVVLLERDEQLATRSSALNAAILRTLDPSPSMTKCLERSARFLQSPPPGFAEHPLVDPCGLILTADEGAAAERLEGWVEHCDPASQPQEIDRRRLEQFAPLFRSRGQRAWLFPHEGRLDVAHLCDSFARGARASGVNILSGAEGHVRELLMEGGRVRGIVRADGSHLQADVVVLASGAWAGAMGARAGSRLRLYPGRRHLLVSEADEHIDPNWPVIWRHGEDFYCRPESGGMLICGCDQTAVDDPDALERDASVLELIAAKTADNLPSLEDAGAAHWWCGLRTMTSDGEFLIQFDPDLPGLFWVAGLGGHGMTGGPEAGRLAAEQLLQQKTPTVRVARTAGV